MNEKLGVTAPRWLRHPAVVIVLVASLVQLVVGALGPLDGDETLYWEWSRHLAWGYYDHPPGVAYMIRLGVEFFGVSAMGVRSMAVLANLGGAMIVIALARRHGGERAATLAALIISCIPVLTNWLMLATPDTLLFLTAMGTVLLVDNALRSPRGSIVSLRWWLFAGAVLGLAALAKELAIILPVAFLLGFLTHKELRPRLAEAGPYLACVVAAAAILPLVLWNRDHDWILLQFVLHRGLGAEPGGAPGREVEYVAGQAAAASPLLFVLLAVAVVRTLRGDRDPRRHLLAVLALVTFGWFAFGALRHPMEVNWAMMAYPPAAILLAVQAARGASHRWLTAALVLGGGMVLLVYLHTATRVLPISPLADPIRRGHGWEEVASHVDVVRRSAAGHATWLAGNRFQDASQLAFYLDGHPPVFSLNIKSRANQYDLWPGFAQRARAGDGLILVVDDSVEDSIARGLAPFFAQLSMGERIVAGGALPPLPPKRIWILEGWRGGWPTP